MLFLVLFAFALWPISRLEAGLAAHTFAKTNPVNFIFPVNFGDNENVNTHDRNRRSNKKSSSSESSSSEEKEKVNDTKLQNVDTKMDTTTIKVVPTTIYTTTIEPSRLPPLKSNFHKKEIRSMKLLLGMNKVAGRRDRDDDDMPVFGRPRNNKNPQNGGTNVPYPVTAAPYPYPYPAATAQPYLFPTGQPYVYPTSNQYPYPTAAAASLFPNPGMTTFTYPKLPNITSYPGVNYFPTYPTLPTNGIPGYFNTSVFSVLPDYFRNVLNRTLVNAARTVSSMMPMFNISNFNMLPQAPPTTPVPAQGFFFPKF